MDEEQRALLMSRLSDAQPSHPTPLGAVKNYWLKAFTFNGRASRREYNWALAGWILGVYAVGGIEIATGLRNSLTGNIIIAPFLLALTVPWVALIARRCHDLNKSGWFGLVMLVPAVGFIIAEAVLMFGDSEPEGARFDAAAPVTE